MSTNKFIIFLIFIVLALASLTFIGINFSNVMVDGGYAAYVYTKPIVGAKEFKQVIKGPGGTGLVWRQSSIKICVTPYTMTEKFEDIRSADQLKMTAEAYLVYRINPNKVKEFVEEYGAISEVDHAPEAIANDAYASFIQQPFRTAVRAAVAQFKGLEAPSRIPEITTLVEKDLSQQLKDTPFIIEGITIGSTIPPESVTSGITRKVEATQEFERQATQLAIAKRSEEIAEAEGRAIANKINQEAQGQLLKAKAEADALRYTKEQEAKAFLTMKKAEAEGMKLEAEARAKLNDATGDNYIRLKFVENLDKLKLPATVISSGEQGDNILKILNIADFKSTNVK